MANPSLKRLIARMEKVRVEIGKHRDKLRELQDEIEALEEPVSNGLQTLQTAIDELSEQA